MTTRLKRKLADLGVDSSSSKANESFCQIGTPLPPLEKSKDTGEFVPLWKQEVRDEKGRRRLHGAFTGGFSAGYFNTVGSKEGWAPSTFVSSRADRAKKKEARPEDFMDDEDLAELAASRTLVDTAEAADILGGTQAELGGSDETDSMAAQLERVLLPATADSAGARLLRKMGWRPGSGVGPRLTYAARRKQDLQFAPANAALPSDANDDDAAEGDKHTYARRDTPLLTPARKDNTHGLGYRSGMNLQESLGGRPGAQAEQGPNLAAGFGLGALNEADDDDVDVYESGVNRGKTRMAYDTLDHEDGERIVMGGRRSAQAAPRPQTRATGGTFKNGQPVLPGFMVADQPAVEDQWFAVPQIPKGWKPDPKRVWQSDKENLDDKPKPATRSHQDWKKGVSAVERGAKLGETPLPEAKRSVFDYMSQKTRERLQSAATQALSTGDPSTVPPSSTSPAHPTPPPTAPAPTTIHIPTTERHLARSALSGFQPFTSAPAKQARYETYLQSQATPESSGPLRPLPGQTVAQFNQEAAEYARSASVFRPMSAAMAGRFTSAAMVEHGPKAVEGLYTPTFASGGTETTGEDAGTEVQKEEEKEEDPKAHAARMGMFGKMTREVKPWRPAKLLCKRFGVREPEIEEEETAAATAGFAAPSASASAEEQSAPQPGEVLAIEAAAAMDDEKPKGPRNLENVGLGEDEWQARDVLTYQRPGMDVFKAIFASDDEDSEDEEKDDEVAAPGPSAAATEPAAPIRETQPESKPPAHLAAQPTTVPEYTPTTPSTSQAGAAPAKVDLASFKPTFVPRSERETKSSKTNGDRTERSKKSKSKAILSFADEDGEDSGLGAPAIPKDKSKKRKDREKDKKGREKKRRREDKAEDEDLWEEKPTPAVVLQLEKQVQAAGTTKESRVEVVTDRREPGPYRQRKRAEDFM